MSEKNGISLIIRMTHTDTHTHTHTHTMYRLYKKLKKEHNNYTTNFPSLKSWLGLYLNIKYNQVISIDQQ